MIECPKCGYENPDGAKGCENCGYDLTKTDNNASKSTFSNKNMIIAIVAIVAVIAVIGILASGMLSDNSDNVAVESDSQSVEPAIEDTSSNDDSSSSSSEYWASDKTDKFHLPTCEWAEKISDENKIIYSSREDAIADGKEPCSVCNP